MLKYWHSRITVLTLQIITICTRNMHTFSSCSRVQRIARDEKGIGLGLCKQWCEAIAGTIFNDHLRSSEVTRFDRVRNMTSYSAHAVTILTCTASKVNGIIGRDLTFLLSSEFCKVDSAQKNRMTDLSGVGKSLKISAAKSVTDRWTDRAAGAR